MTPLVAIGIALGLLLTIPAALFITWLTDETRTMSTSYYVRGHNQEYDAKIGQVTAIGGGRTSFDWEHANRMLPPAPAMCQCCNRELPEPQKTIEDEYGRVFTNDEFLNLVFECDDCS